MSGASTSLLTAAVCTVSHGPARVDRQINLILYHM
jgi:hypothetical protein